MHERLVRALANRQADNPPYKGHPYDNTLKLLMEKREEEVIPQILPGAAYIETLNADLPRDPLRVDRVYRVWYRGENHLLDVEFETDSKDEMALRLLEYHAFFLRKYKLPVLSLIVYPFPTTVVESPLEEKSGDEILLTFTFSTLCLWKLSAAKYVQEHILCMYSLLPAMDGAGARLLMQAIDEMAEHYQNDMYRLSDELIRFSLLLRRAKKISPEEQRQVEEKLSMWDNLIEQDPKWQKMRAESRNEGIQEGITAMHVAILGMLKERFPSLAQPAQASVERITQLNDLTHLTVELSIARDEATARRAIEAHLPR